MLLYEPYRSFNLLCLIAFCYACNQKSVQERDESEQLLIGTWIGIKKELRNGETGENYTNDNSDQEYQSTN
jgi:hypothetical protein